MRQRNRSKSRPTRTASRSKSRTKSRPRRTTRGGQQSPGRAPAALPFGLGEYATRVYSKYDAPPDYKVLDELRANFIKGTASMGDGPEGKYPLQIFHINPEGVTYESEKKSDRNEMNFTLFKDAYQWAKQNNMPIPTITMYLWVSDTHPYYLTDIDKKFPIMSYCSPANMDYILFPDESFACLQVSQKYKGECKNFDQVKALILEHIPKTKIDQIYFKGVPTTDRQSRLREDLEKIAAVLPSKPDTPRPRQTPTRSPSKAKTPRKSPMVLSSKPAKSPTKSPSKSPAKIKSPELIGAVGGSQMAKPRMLIKLDAWSVYEPLYEWSKYKWLLNLPGRYPWSNRFRWLFLMKSGVINVDVQTVGRGYTDYAYMSFINLIVKPGIDFINIDTVYNNKIRPGAHPSQADLDAQYNENTRVYQAILDQTAAMPEAKYNEMVESGFNKVNTLTSALVSQYIYSLMVENAKLITTHT